MKKHITFICIFLFVIVSAAFGQKMTVKDSDSNILMEVNDEGTVGSITLPAGSIPAIITNKLYNVSGSLYWNGSALATSSGVTGSGSAGQVSFWTGAASISGDNGLFWDNTNKYLGIGTTNPGEALHVMGGVVRIEGTGNRRVELVGGPRNWYLDAPGGGYFAIRDHTAGVDRLHINTSGNIGMGTSSPISKLDVRGVVLGQTDGANVISISGSNKAAILGASGGATVSGAAGYGAVTGFTKSTNIGESALFGRVFSPGTATGLIVKQDGTGDIVRFIDVNTTVFVVKDGGNVGIGTTTPSEKLELAGTAQMTGFKMPTDASDGYVLTSSASGVGTWQPPAGGGWSLTGNSSTTSGTNFLGTTDNQALELKVNSARVLRLEPSLDPNAESPNILAGSSYNSITAGVVGATIGGGGIDPDGNGPLAPTPNRITDDLGTVGGGANNQAGDNTGTTLDARYATVSGGEKNVASGAYSTVSGGTWNTAGNADFTTVSGGANNTASAPYATVPGGNLNTAGGQLSFAAGYRAKANHNGTFVWADYTNADFVSTNINQFLIRASAGVGVGTTSPTAMLDVNGSTGYNQIRMRSSYTPTGTGDTNGNVGDIAWDDDYLYVKTSVGWKRAALSTW